VEIEYPEAFQQALLKVLDVKKTFRYVYLGGALTESNQEKKLWFYAKGRHVRVCPHLFRYRASCSLECYMLTPRRGLPRQIF
jgi:hypothetical protein